MLPFPLVYSDRYDLNIGDHVFQARKYRLLRDYLLRKKLADDTDFIAPGPASTEDLALAHDVEWIRRLATGTITYQEVLKLEIPYSRKTVEAFFLAAGGSILAARKALKCRIACNIGGGFHHAFGGHGEGFCAINDIAVAIRRLQKDGLVRRAMVVDCDVHQGNGTAAIFHDDPAVFTYSIHQENNYPMEKPPSDLDVNLPDRTRDADYLEHLRSTLVPALQGFRPELVLYVAGADPYHFDQLGGLGLTMTGLAERDSVVFQSSLESGACVAVVLAGGYAFDHHDTVLIHANTVIVAAQVLGVEL
jgi:acetoin utilization deacetylase AcuC-like enzyme